MCVCAVGAWEVGSFPLPAPSSCPEEASQPHVGKKVTLALIFQAQSHVDGGREPRWDWDKSLRWG